ncbi:MAG: hypothetical protein ACOC5L_04130 [Halobacteriota archaeon]
MANVIITMEEASCSQCGKEVGGLVKLFGYKCPSCEEVFCKNCPPTKNYLLTTKAYCPKCGKELTKYHVPR